MEPHQSSSTPEAPLMQLSSPRPPANSSSLAPVVSNAPAQSGPPKTPKANKSEGPPKILAQNRILFNGTKTESWENLLQTLACLKSAVHLQHLHIFIYFPYTRWMTDLPKSVFGVDCFPQYEGWRQAWIRPISTGPFIRKVMQFGDPVLLVDIVFYDSSSMNGYITKKGELLGIHKSHSPINGIKVDPNFTKSCYDIFDVSRLFTVEEMKAEIRGSFYGSSHQRTHSCKVWTIVASEKEDSSDNITYKVRKIPVHDDDQGEFVKIPAQTLNEYCPEMVAEWNHRKAPATLSKAEMLAVTPYMEKLFKRAMDENRFARDCISTVLKPIVKPTELESTLSTLEELKRAV